MKPVVEEVELTVATDDEMNLTEEADDENNTKESKNKFKEEFKPPKKIKTELPALKQDDGEKEVEQIGAVSDVENSNLTRIVRKCDKSLDKAVEEIKKGGSLKSVALLYNVPEEVLYQKLVSRSLPKETELLTSFEENNLVRWILRSNENNILVYKQSLMEKVGKMKKVSKITPIFCRSKFGKMWYDYFLRTHSEILELEGIILPSVNYKRVFAQRLKKRTSLPGGAIKRYKGKSNGSKKETIDLASLYGIKEIKVTLQDFKTMKNFDYVDEGSGFYTKIGTKSKNEVPDGSVEFILNDDDSNEYFEGFENNLLNYEDGRLMGKDISNTISSQIHDSESGWNKEDDACEKCSETFSNLSKLKTHLLTCYTKN